MVTLAANENLTPTRLEHTGRYLAAGMSTTALTSTATSKAQYASGSTTDQLTVHKYV